MSQEVYLQFQKNWKLHFLLHHDLQVFGLHSMSEEVLWHWLSQSYLSNCCFCIPVSSQSIIVFLHSFTIPHEKFRTFASTKCHNLTLQCHKKKLKFINTKPVSKSMCTSHNPTSKFHNLNFKICRPNFTIISPNFTIRRCPRILLWLRELEFNIPKYESWLIWLVPNKYQISIATCSMHVQTPVCFGSLRVKHMSIVIAALDGLQFHVTFCSYSIANLWTWNFKQPKQFATLQYLSTSTFDAGNWTVGIISTNCIPCFHLAMPEHETDAWCPKGNPSVAQDPNKWLPL